MVAMGPQFRKINRSRVSSLERLAADEVLEQRQREVGLVLRHHVARPLHGHVLEANFASIVCSIFVDFGSHWG